MSKSVGKIFLFLVSLSLLIRCDQYEFPESPYPRIETLPASGITEDGVTLQGNITTLGKSAITDHGFIWGLTEGISINNSEKASIGPASQIGVFEKSIDFGLYADTTYYVKAFVRTASYIVYGKLVTFKSKGSSSPIITELVPSEGTWGDTILIKGDFFSTKADINNVKFGSRPAIVLESTTTTIKCIVPGGINTASTPVSISVVGNQSQASQDFRNTTPSIESFVPETGTYGDVVTISGNRFTWVYANIQVKFNGHPAQVLRTSKTRVTVKVPNEVVEKLNEISVTVGVMSTTATDKFTMLPPSVTGISVDKGFIGQTILIDGDNFSPLPAGNTVLYGNNLAEVVTASKKQLTVKIPQGIYKERANAFAVTVAEQTAVSVGLFTIQDVLTRKANIPAGDYTCTLFSIAGYGYVVNGHSTMRFEPLSNTWTMMAQFPGDERFDPQSFSTTTRGYVGLGVSLGGSEIADFWEYNPSNNTWRARASFPINTSSTSRVLLGANNKGYLAVGFGTLNMIEFNPGTNRWTWLPGDQNTFFVNYPHRPDAGFVINNRLFVYLADETTAANPVYEYDVANSTWISQGAPKAVDEWSDYYSIGFSLNGKGYILGNGLYKFDPGNVTWEIKPRSLLIGNSGSFILNGKAYFVGAWLNPGFELWEYDPAFE